jgi:hypothetical protein
MWKLTLGYDNCFVIMPKHHYCSTLCTLRIRFYDITIVVVKIMIGGGIMFSILYNLNKLFF